MSILADRQYTLEHFKNREKQNIVINNKWLVGISYELQIK